MDFSQLNVKVEDGIGSIEINRPDKANALDGQTWQELGAAFRWAHETDAVRVVILSGAGKHFCAGIDYQLLMAIMADIQGRPEGRKQEALHERIKELQGAFSAAESCSKPVIAAIQGGCLGGGVDLVSACDIRIAAHNSRFAIKEIDLGIVADVGTLQRLPHVVSQSYLRDWAFTGRDVMAAEALQSGLVSRLVDPDDLLPVAHQLAEVIKAKSPLTVRGLKGVLNKTRDLSVRDGLDYVAAWNASMLLSQDTQIACSAVMSRSQPKFPD